ncbi:lysozyme [Paenochrobactrum glaciei]|uniref:Lysozyme n=1 Tax=Paenochrobactrum glaciei TaxID=486407 RepID=A0ABP3RQ09_9HYPH
MVLIRPIEASRSIDIGGIPDTRVDNSVGQGLSQIGGALSNHADMQNQMALRRQQMEQQVDDFATNQAFQRWQDDNALDFAKHQEGMAPSGKGFTDNVSGIFTKRSEDFLKSVPDSLKPKFAELVATARNQWIDKGAAAEIDQRNNWYRTSITERQQTLQNQVFNDPAMFDAARQDVHRTIDASGLSLTEKEKLKKQADEMLSLTIGEREIRNAEANPGSAVNAAGRLGVTGVVTTSRGGDAMSLLRKFEGFRETTYWDVNAHRVGYGSDTITTADGRVIRVEKGMKVNRSDAERDLARRTKEFEKAASSKIGAENWNNLPPNVQAALVSVAYNYGSLPGNVVDAARSGDIARIAASVEFRGNDNGGVNRKRRAEEASIIRGSSEITRNAPAFDPASMDPRYANLSLSQRLSLYDQMNAAAQRGQSVIDAQVKAAYESEKSALQLGIQTGEVSSEQQIMQSNMRDSDKATLLSALRTRQGDQFMTAQALSDFQNGALSIDPYSSDGKKKVDAIGGVINQSVAPENRQAVLEQLIAQSGTVPQSTLNQLRAGAESQVPSEVEAALQAASRFSQVNPSALSRRDGGSAVQKKVDDFDYYVNSLNLSPSEAAKRIAEQNDPNKIRERKALEPAAKEFRKQIENTDIGSMFDDSWLPFNDPKVGFTEMQAAGIAADYLAIAEEQFYASGGNPELAKNRANAEMKRLYGATEITGTKTVMKYPPEKFWPAKADENDPYGYVKDQLINDLAAMFPDDQLLNPKKDGEQLRGMVEGREVLIRNESGLDEYRRMTRDQIMNRVVLVSTPETGSEAKSNQLPGYTVLYKDEQGNLQTLYGKQWRPDLSVVSAAAKQQQAKRIETAERNQVSGLGMAEYMNGGDIPMGASSAWDNPEAQQIIPTPSVSNVPSMQSPTIKSDIAEQRSELFQDAKSNGLLNAGGH